MKTLLETERRLLELLSSAIQDRKPQADLFVGLSEASWQAVEKLAREQAVLGLVADRILELPIECLPDRDASLRLAIYIDNIQHLNLQLNKRLREIKRRYDQEGLPFALLKGQTLAFYYPRPLLRAPGDLDLYLYREGDYERANHWAREQGYRLEGNSVYEQLYWYKGIAVENHLYLSYFGYSSYDEKLAEILAPIIREDAFARLDLEGEVYRTLPLELNVVYVFQHILHHFSYMGIGLRQICDWIVLLQEHEGELDVDKVVYYAEYLDLLQPMGYFALMAKKYLGARPEIFPFSLPSGAKAEARADAIIRDIFTGGNFGLELYEGRKFANAWAKRAFMFYKSLRRSVSISSISPEHIRWAPFHGAKTRIKLTLSSLLDRR